MVEKIDLKSDIVTLRDPVTNFSWIHKESVKQVAEKINEIIDVLNINSMLTGVINTDKQ